MKSAIRQAFAENKRDHGTIASQIVERLWFDLFFRSKPLSQKIHHLSNKIPELKELSQTLEDPDLDQISKRLFLFMKVYGYELSEAKTHLLLLPGTSLDVKLKANDEACQLVLTELEQFICPNEILNGSEQ